MRDKQKEALQKIKVNKLDEAAALYIEYTEEHPEDPIGYVNVGSVLFQSHQLEEAEKFFLEAIQINDQTATAYYGLGNLYYQQEMYEYAEKMFTKCLALGLDEAEVYFLLGMSHQKRSNHILAMPFLQTAAEKDKQPNYQLQYGLALAHEKYYDEARNVFLAMIETDETQADALYNLGVIAFLENKKTMAQDYLNKAMAAQPSHTLAQQALEQMKNNAREDE